VRITDLTVDGFGVWSGLELADLSDQLNVFYGPNEAGKTTLMQFVRSMLYGFSPERRARYLPPVRAGRPGGTLHAVDGQSAYAIGRHADVPDAPDTAIVTDDKQTVHEPGALAALLGEVDEPTFNNVFAFGLREIQELGTLSDTQAADELYNLALGVDRVSLLEVVGQLEASRNRLLAPDDRPSLVTQLLSQRHHLRGEIEDLGQSTVRYMAMLSERQRLDGEIGRLESESARFEKQQRELALARALDDRWQRRGEIDRQRQVSIAFDSLPSDALARFDRLQARLSARRRRFVRLQAERRTLRVQIEQLKINEALGRAAPRLEALAEQQVWIESLSGQVGRLEAEIADLEAQRQKSHAQLGITPPATGSRAEPISKHGLSELHAVARSMRGPRRELQKVGERIAAAGETATGFEKKMGAALGGANDKGLTPALAEAGELVSQLRNRVQLDERLDQMSRRAAELEEQSHERLEKQMLPSWVLAGLGCLFVLGCAMVLLAVAGLVLPISLGATLGWPVGLVGVLAAVAAGGIKFGMDRNATNQLDSCHGQMHLLAQQIQQAKADRDELDAKLPRGGGPLVARLQTAEKALARLEGLLPLESQRDSAKREVDEARRQHQALRGKCKQLRGEWQRLLAVHGLPAALTPRALADYVRGREQTRGLEQVIDQKQLELNERRREYQTVTARITQLAAEVGVPPSALGPLDQLRHCLADLKEHHTRLKRRDELAEQSARLRRRKIRLSQGADKLRQRRQWLLRAAGTTDEQEFRHRAQAQADAQRLAAERARLDHEISAALADQCTEEQLAQWLSGQQNLEQLEMMAADSRTASTTGWNAALVRRGELNQQLKTLLDDRQLAHKHIELGIVEKRLQDALDRWRVLAVSGMILDAVRQYYEREHQPPALREASGHLQRLTGGRYTRVWTPLGEHALRVDDAQGQSLRVEVLSRGTREQLFLALRLALISSYARRGIHLPLVLDDVLVNFDIVRAKAAAGVLRDFARQGNQVLIFTCHEHISKLFKNIKADVRQLPDNGRPQTLQPEETVDKRPSRPRRAPPSEPEPAPEPEYVPEIEEVEAEPVAEEVVVPARVEPPAPPPIPRPEPRVEVAIEPVKEVAPPRPRPRPVRHRTERVEWSAEEFEGELADRVRRTDEHDALDADDAEAA
jgi:uncharacterized protein YhaN